MLRCTLFESDSSQTEMRIDKTWVKQRLDVWIGTLGFGVFSVPFSLCQYRSWRSRKYRESLLLSKWGLKSAVSQNLDGFGLSLFFNKSRFSTFASFVQVYRMQITKAFYHYIVDCSVNNAKTHAEKVQWTDDILDVPHISIAKKYPFYKLQPINNYNCM